MWPILFADYRQRNMGFCGTNRISLDGINQVLEVGLIRQEDGNLFFSHDRIFKSYG